MTRKKEIVIAEEEKQIDETNKVKKKSFVRVSGQNKSKSTNAYVKTNKISKSKAVDLLDAEVLDEDDDHDGAPKRHDIIDIDDYKDSETEVILDDSDILPALREEEAEQEDEEDENLDLDDSFVASGREHGLVATNALQRYLAELRKYSLMSRKKKKRLLFEPMSIMI